MWLEWYVCNYCRCIVGVLFHRGVHEVIFCCLVYIEMVIIMFNIEPNLVALMFWMETKIFYEFLLWISFWLIRCFSLEWILICQQTCFSKETGKIKEKKKKKQSHINEMWQLNVSELMAFKAFNFFQICCLLSSSAFMSMGQLCRPLPGLSFCSFSNIFGSFLL